MSLIYYNRFFVFGRSPTTRRRALFSSRPFYRRTLGGARLARARRRFSAAPGAGGAGLRPAATGRSA